MEKIIPVNMLQQYKDDIRLYALYINRVRAIPLVKDGLKAIHRRIVYAEYNYSKAINGLVKSSAVVGDVMKYLHPHGDAGIYAAMKPLNNWFEINMPLLSGDGNWGNFQGDSAAAPRYTETKLSEFCLDVVLSELKEMKNVVDWNETYDGKTQEPTELSPKIPLLLINGSFGIGYGLKVEIPTHNINEVIDCTINLMKNPDAPVVLIPDQCMPCEIIEANWKSISNKGNGNFKVRGVIDIDNTGKKPVLIIRSVPDLVFLDNIKDSIEKMIEKKQLPQITKMEDHSEEIDKYNTIMEFRIELKAGSDPNYVRDIIYKNTAIEKTVKVNFEVLNGFNPLRMSYKSYLESFIEFRKMTKFRVYCNRLQDVQTKLHEMEAYIKVLQSGEIDNIINMIKGQQSIDDTYLIEYLIEKLHITDLQAKFIIQSNIKKLSIGYLNKYNEEYIQLCEMAKLYTSIITDDKYIEDEIIQELLDAKKKYGKPRKCKIISQAEVNNIPRGTFKIIITENNFIKKVGAESSIGSFKGDSPKYIITADNEQNILLFDVQGRVFKLPVHKIPISNTSSNGIDIRTIIKKLTSDICNIMYEPDLVALSKDSCKFFMTILTAGGNIKKLDLEDFLSVPPSGILYMKLSDGDTVKDVDVINDTADIIVYSKNKALRMSMSEVPHQKRNSKGMRAITEPEVDGLAVIKPDTTDVVVITESGKINRFSVVALPNLGRNKAGSKVIKLGKGDSINSILTANPNDIITVKTKNNSLEILVSNLDLGSSISAGKKIIPMNNDNIIKCKVVHQ